MDPGAAALRRGRLSNCNPKADLVLSYGDASAEERAKANLLKAQCYEKLGQLGDALALYAFVALPRHAAGVPSHGRACPPDSDATRRGRRKLLDPRETDRLPTTLTGCPVRVFLDARDLIALLELRSPSGLATLRERPSLGGHQLVLTPTVVFELFRNARTVSC